MDYIVLDMEWNQPWPGSPSSKKVLPVAIRGEIIQIGAVRVTESREVADEFQVMVKPKYYRHLNRRVSKLTGIKESRLRDEGVPFPEAMEQFRKWCGEDIVFLTWGFDDITILRENLRLFNLPEDWTDRWFNAQMIFNAQTDGSTAQKALKTAMEMFNIEATRPAHDALGDAYHTALICARLDLARGTQEYEQALKSHENGFHGAQLPGCLARKVFYDFADKRAALSAMAGEENECPVCGKRMLGSRWFAQPGHRYMDLATCPEHGKFLIRVRLSEQPNGLVRVSRLTYEATSEAAQAYAHRAEKADPEEQTASRRRRRRRSAAGEIKSVTE
ncbi:MAG: exonuclease domain-containing protein [Ruminococcaceae bacterium]|nr:exonuclease domain-containing protein [Oscillospiraceae bacterium]